MTTVEALLALNMLPGIGPVRVRRLLEAFGEPVRILTASASEVRRVQGFGEELTGILTKWQNYTDS
jgi:DNA processing protein